MKWHFFSKFLQNYSNENAWLKYYSWLFWATRNYNHKPSSVVRKKEVGRRKKRDNHILPQWFFSFWSLSIKNASFIQNPSATQAINLVWLSTVNNTWCKYEKQMIKWSFWKSQLWYLASVCLWSRLLEHEIEQEANGVLHVHVENSALEREEVDLRMNEAHRVHSNG